MHFVTKYPDLVELYNFLTMVITNQAPLLILSTFTFNQYTNVVSNCFVNVCVVVPNKERNIHRYRAFGSIDSNSAIFHFNVIQVAQLHTIILAYNDTIQVSFQKWNRYNIISMWVEFTLNNAQPTIRIHLPTMTVESMFYM